MDGPTSQPQSLGEPIGRPAAPEHATAPCSLSEFLLYFVRLGTFGFGGPIALVGHMQKDLVDDRRWISKQDYLEGLALAQLAPGPLAAQLAMYLGWVRAGVLGATLVSAAFIMPSFIMTVAIAVAYLRYGGLGWIQGAFYGIGAAVIAIIARSAWKLTKLSLKRDLLLWATFAVTGVVTAVTEGAIAGAAFVLGRRAIVDVPTVLIAAATLTVLVMVKKVPEPIVILAAGVVGVALRGVSP